MTASNRRAREQRRKPRAAPALAVLLVSLASLSGLALAPGLAPGLAFAPDLAFANDPAQAAPAPVTSGPALAGRARAILKAFCEDCRAHETEGTLDMDALARDPRLIVPRFADGSRAYQRLFAQIERQDKSEAKTDVSKSQPTNANATAQAAPAAPRFLTYAEIAAVRDWIEALPVQGDCDGRLPVTPAKIAELTGGWRDSIGAAEAAGTRFVSLAHLWNACVPALRLVTYRAAAGPLLAALAPGKGKRPDFETLGDESVILAVRPGEIGLTAAEWDALMADAPAGMTQAVPLDWLAARVIARTEDPGGDGLKLDGASQHQIADLARAWAGDVDLARAAAEQGEPPEALAAKLASQQPDGDLPAQRLLHGALSRDAWAKLARALSTGRAGDTGNRRAPENEIDIVLWTDRAAYRPRELVEIYASASTACHLTVIGIDQDGRAIVLFPNELEPGNLVPARVPVRIPGSDAGYQLRFDRAGTETLVAICQRNDTTPDGISYDYEKQRFAALGDWRGFLSDIPKLEKEIRESETRQRSRRRRGRSEPQQQPATATAPGDPTEGRTAIRVKIEARLSP